MSGNVYKPAKWFNHRYGASSSSLRGWEKEGLVRALRFPGGKRSYDVQQVQQLLAVPIPTQPEKKGYIYARVSSAKQKEDLARQVGRLVSAYPSHKVIQDIGSGINFKRKGLRALLDRVHEGLVSEVVVLHKDRLSRFASDLLEYFFKQAGVKFVVHCADQDLERSSELAEDLLAITTVYVASHNGKRSAQSRRATSQKRGSEEGSAGQEDAKRRRTDGRRSKGEKAQQNLREPDAGQANPGSPDA